MSVTKTVGLTSFCLSVCAASGLLAGALGHLAQFLYIPWVGFAGFAPLPIIDLYIPPWLLGGGSGVLAGVLWCGVMVPRALARPVGDRIILRGILWGIVVAILSTSILHAGLKLMSEPHIPSALGAGLMIFGVPAGIIMGLICGAILGGITGPQGEAVSR